MKSPLWHKQKHPEDYFVPQNKHCVHEINYVPLCTQFTEENMVHIKKRILYITPH